jgi:hypothetical protein
MTKDPTAGLSVVQGGAVFCLHPSPLAVFRSTRQLNFYPQIAFLIYCRFFAARWLVQEVNRAWFGPCADGLVFYHQIGVVVMERHLLLLQEALFSFLICVAKQRGGNSPKEMLQGTGQ